MSPHQRMRGSSNTMKISTDAYAIMRKNKLTSWKPTVRSLHKRVSVVIHSIDKVKWTHLKGYTSQYNKGSHSSASLRPTNIAIEKLTHHLEIWHMPRSQHSPINVFSCTKTIEYSPENGNDQDIYTSHNQGGPLSFIWCHSFLKVANQQMLRAIESSVFGASQKWHDA